MEQIEIIKRDGTRIRCFSAEPFCTPTQAVQETALMSDDTVKITLRTSEPYKFDKGDRVEINGYTYKIRTTAERTLQTESDYIHSLTFYGVMYDLMKCQYRNTDVNGNSSKAIFDLTYSIKDFIKVAINNLNRDNPGEWAFDEENCPDTEPITVSFSKNNVLQVIQDLCSKGKFNLEFRITTSQGVNTIHIGKFGSVVAPPSGADFFEYGKGNGLWQLREKKVDDKAVITRLWAEGGTQNIRSGYRDYSDRIQLPFPKRLNAREHRLKDGTVVAPGSQVIGIDDDCKRYLEDVAMSQAMGVEEDTQTFDDIYPRRTGVVSAVGEDILEFVDDTMDFDLTARDGEGNTLYLIAGSNAKLTFITGKLAGQEFEISGYNHATKTFRIIPYTDERGLKMPTEDTDAFRFAVGDKYKLTDINMPDSYVENAEEDLWFAALDYFNEAKQVRCQYELTFDRKYFQDNMPVDSDMAIFKVGDYVPIKDTRFGVEKNIRIQKVSRNLLLDHDYSLTLSDTTAISVQVQTVLDVIQHEKLIQINELRDLERARRGWKFTEELRDSVYDTDGYFDPENIRPNSIDTNMLTVGSKSQQFVLTGVILQANYGGQPNQFHASSGILSHLSIKDDGVRIWNMAEAEVTLTQPGVYYVFAKCSKNGNNGVWYVTQEQLKVEEVSDPNNYYFQVGIIGSLSQGATFRDFITTYGFTRINGSTITTGKIVTSDGGSYLDLDGNKFIIGDSSSSFDYNVTRPHRITLKNVDVVSGAGDPVALGVYRGVFDPAVVYYSGDSVSYTHNGETATYRYVNPDPSRGHLPTEGSYWAVEAKGKNGQDGQPGAPGVSAYVHIRYAPVPNPTDAQMSTVPNKYIGTCTDNNPTAPLTASSYTWAKFMGDDGEDGADGKDGKDGERGYPGEPGEDGRTSYLHIKYSNDGGLTFTENNGETPGSYLGQYVDFEEYDSSNPADYTWGLIEGSAGVGGSDAEAGNYYEYRYAKNGSRTTAPDLDRTASDPEGWSTVQPTLGVLEYMWQTICVKSALKQKALFHIPVRFGEAYTCADESGHGCDIALGRAFTAEVGGRTALAMPQNALATMYDSLPFGESFTLCFWVRTDQTYIDWCLNGKWGVSSVEKRLPMGQNQWTHIALRFTEKSLTLFKNGVLTDTASLVEKVVGFSMYDDNMFGSDIYMDDIWCLSGALADNDIIKIKDGSYDELVSVWSVPVRITPYDGTNGKSIHSVENEYAINNNASVPPTTGWSTTPTAPTASNRYLWGREVVKDGDGEVISTTTPHIMANYSADGQDGDDGDPGKGIASITEYYLVTSAAIGVTRGSNGWSTTPGTTTDTKKYLWNYEKIVWTDGSVTYVEPFIIGVHGTKGDQGEAGVAPACPYRGNYDSSKHYFGSAIRCDIVKYNGIYYIARTDAGEFYNVTPSTSAPGNQKWNTFGSQYESVATDLLLAINANIAGWIFRNNRLESQASDIYLDGVNNRIGFGNGMLIDGTDFVQLRDSTSGNILAQIAPDTVANLISRTGIRQITASNTSSTIQDSGSAGEVNTQQFQMASLSLGSITSGQTLIISGISFDPSYFPTGDRDDDYFGLAVKMKAYIKRNGVTVGTTNISFGLWSDSWASLTPWEPINLTFSQAGTYTIVFDDIEYTFDNSQSNHYNSVNTHFTYTAEATVQVSARNIIGTDGFWCFKDMLHYFKMTHDDGFEIREGSYGLRVTTAGLRKTVNGGNTWTTL